MRLIDADELLADRSIQICIGAGDNICIDVADIANAPTIDAVPVVRCRECKWFKPYQKPVEDFDGRCVVHMCETDEEEYCSIGRRKDNATD